MEFSNLKHLARGYGVRKRNRVEREYHSLTGPGRQPFLQCQCNVSVFSRPCSCCLHKKNTVSGDGDDKDGKTEYIPMTQLLPSASLSSVALTHLGLLPKTSWLICSYPAGPKCFRQNLDFPILG